MGSEESKAIELADRKSELTLKSLQRRQMEIAAGAGQLRREITERWLKFESFRTGLGKRAAPSSEAGVRAALLSRYWEATFQAVLPLRQRATELERWGEVCTAELARAKARAEALSERIHADKVLVLERNNTEEAEDQNNLLQFESLELESGSGDIAGDGASAASSLEGVDRDLEPGFDSIGGQTEVRGCRSITAQGGGDPAPSETVFTDASGTGEQEWPGQRERGRERSALAEAEDREECAAWERGGESGLCLEYTSADGGFYNVSVVRGEAMSLTVKVCGTERDLSAFRGERRGLTQALQAAGFRVRKLLIAGGAFET